ncbi:MAG: AraC family transcriptional regulator [Dongiaceae bacterium]
MDARVAARPDLALLDERQDFRFGQYAHREGEVYGPIHGFMLSLIGLRRGRVALEVDGAERLLCGGEAALILSERRVRYRFLGRPDTHILWCETQDPPRFHGPAPAPGLPWAAQPLTARLAALFRLGLGLERGAGAELTALRGALARSAFLEFLHRSRLVVEERPLPPAVLRARRHIEAHFRERLTVAALARQVGVAPQHLFRLFRAHLGCTPGAYLWSVRCEQGLYLLHQTGLKIAEAAYQAGFQSPNHFSRLMKRRYGRAPRELRQSRWRGES